jgi:hypothetical protein
MSEEPLDTLRWPLSYYLPRVARPEVGSLNLNHVGMKGFLAMAMNFAWFRKTKTDANEPFDVDNSTLFQCFRNYKRVPSTWRIWMFDVLNERAVRSGGLLETRYQDGTAPPLCNDPVFPSGGAIASQNTIKALSESSYACPQRTNWRDIVKYWYGVGTDVVPGAKPGLSSVGSHVENGKIKLTFRAETSGANTAWEFHLDRRVTAGSTPGPRRIATLPFRWRSRTMPNCIQARRAVPTCYTYTPPDSGCYEYRVRAWNPVGPAQWVSFTQPGKGLSTSGVCSLG